MNTTDCYTFKFVSGNNTIQYILGIVMIGIACFCLGQASKIQLTEILFIVFFSSIGLLFIYATWSSKDDFIKLDKNGITINQCNELRFTRIKKQFNWAEIENLRVVPAMLSGSFNLELYGKNYKLLGSYSVALKHCVEDPNISITEAYRRLMNLPEEKDKNWSEEHYINDLRVRLPLIQKICLLNPNAIKFQLELVREYFSDKDLTKYIIVKDSEYSIDDCFIWLNKQELTIRKAYMSLLFKLAVSDDGIKNDEWIFLHKTMSNLNFNHHYVEYFDRYYAPLRTEYDYDSYYSNNQTSQSSASQSAYLAYYNLLGLSEGCSAADIQKAYHQKALEHHPDLPKNSNRVETCKKMMADLNEAYAVLMQLK